MVVSEGGVSLVSLLLCLQSLLKIYKVSFACDTYLLKNLEMVLQTFVPINDVKFNVMVYCDEIITFILFLSKKIVPSLGTGKRDIIWTPSPHP